MPRKGVKYPYGWTLVDENIENVERVQLDPETQQELGCLVGEHVFLEYPWAYVHRDVVARFAKLTDSSLARFQEKIQAYESDTFLVGYSSTRLNSDEFVICLTEQAKRLVCQRNKNITRIILRRVIGKVIKTAKSWNSLGSDTEINETFVRNTREFFEIEIVLPGRVLNSSRILSDRDANASRDSYMELVNKEEKFKNVDRKRICRSVQTYLQSRETFVQTYLGYLRNAWTQYVYEDAVNEAVSIAEGIEDEGKLNEVSERNDDNRSQGKDTIRSKENDEGTTVEKTPLELFLEARSHGMIDVIKYNAAVNLHVDDIKNLSRQECESEKIPQVFALYEQESFIHLNLTAHKIVSDVSLHPKLTEYVAISYITDSNGVCKNDGINGSGFQCRVLVWKLNDPLGPRLELQDHREVYSVCFCPYNENLVIGGCSTGQVIIWNIEDRLRNSCNGSDIKIGTSRRYNTHLSVVRPIIVSDKRNSHRLPVRKIRWIPAKYRIEPNGKLSKPSTSSGVQFLTVSEDGSVAVWNISLNCRFFSENDENSDEPFQPMFRLRIPVPSESSQRFTPLCFSLPPINVLDQSHEFNLVKEKGYTKSLWIGCAEGLIKCTWEKQTEEKLLECDILNCSYVHDGPVTEITRSSHLQNILLTIGGQVFAIWNDDYMDSPLFWRRTSSRYTACCWVNEPGVFLLGCQEQGRLEMWNIKDHSNQPIFTQVISSKSITHLTLLQSSSVFDSNGLKMIGVGDRGGQFRVFKEPQASPNDVTKERMVWFKEYVWREAQRKKMFTSWQNDFLANDPVVVAKRLARRDEQRKRKTEEAKERIRRERETRLKLKAEKRTPSAPVPNDVAWKSKQYDRMKEVLLNKKGLVPSEIEAKRIPLVTLKAERDKNLEKVENKLAHRDAYFLNALSKKFPQLLEPKIKVSSTLRNLPK